MQIADNSTYNVAICWYSDYFAINEKFSDIHRIYFDTPENQVIYTY